jgi:hypothetical protein
VAGNFRRRTRVHDFKVVHVTAIQGRPTYIVLPGDAPEPRFDARELTARGIFNVNFKDLTVDRVASMIGVLGKLNVIVAPQAAPVRITLRLQRVTAIQALHVAAAITQLSVVKEKTASGVATCVLKRPGARPIPEAPAKPRRR